jgi:hypothetical protein
MYFYNKNNKTIYSQWNNLMAQGIFEKAWAPWGKVVIKGFLDGENVGDKCTRECKEECKFRSVSLSLSVCSSVCTFSFWYMFLLSSFVPCLHSFFYFFLKLYVLNVVHSTVHRTLKAFLPRAYLLLKIEPCVTLNHKVRTYVGELLYQFLFNCWKLSTDNRFLHLYSFKWTLSRIPGTSNEAESTQLWTQNWSMGTQNMWLYILYIHAR